MIPAALSHQIKKGIEDFLLTTFPVSNPFFHGMFERLFVKNSELFQGPYISIILPFKTGAIDTGFFENIPTNNTPYLHQEKAFKRLQESKSDSTIIATGTGSGKTECFLYPILDYCYKHRDEDGIKAIIIYPMNALATDQARRFAQTIYQNPELKNRVTAGLYIGQKGLKASMTMTADSVITDRDAMRLRPPDILLTNYKMLDYLLIRPQDNKLWQFNNPDTLKYLVVDELHTFDGAKASDIACLIRRLKSRFKSPKGHICCVGTSATLGADETVEDIQNFAEQVFAESFDVNSIVRESLLTTEEFFKDQFITRFDPISVEKTDSLNPDKYDSFESYISAQHEIWFGKPIDDFQNNDWMTDLASKLKEHAFFRNLLLVLNNKVLSSGEIIRAFEKIDSFFAGSPEEYKNLILNSIISLVSCAKISVDDNNLSPFLNVRIQLWLRELRRMVSDIKAPPDIKFYDDLKEDQFNNHLPIIHCRECGAIGWAGTKKEQDVSVNPDLQHFYLTFFNHGPTLTLIFPYDDKYNLYGQQKFKEYFYGHCLRVFHKEDESKSCPACGNADSVIRVIIPATREKKGDRQIGSHDCPFCQSANSLMIVGSRAASLISVAISQLFASNYNDDKKLLTFSDSVQDASHRAGFFSARTYRFNFRTALQQFLLKGEKRYTLSDIPAAFIKFWRKEMTESKFITTFIPPDMTWLRDYEDFLNKKGVANELDRNIKSRIHWEIISEFGFNSRIGRTLEKTNSSIAYFKKDRIDSVAEKIIEQLQNEIGGLSSLDVPLLQRFVLGLLNHLKSRGAIFFEALRSYIENFGAYYQISRINYMPNFSKFSRTPIFLSTKAGIRFDSLISRARTHTTWYEDWIEKNLKHLSNTIGEYSDRIYSIILEALVKENIIDQHEIRGQKIWSIDPSSLDVGLDIVQFRCEICNHNVSVIEDETDFWKDKSVP